MVRARDLLARFRPAGSPGGATSAGVPADRAAGLAGELTPVFDALAPVLEECARIHREAQEAARAHEADGLRRAHDIVARARIESEAERAGAAATARARAAGETERRLAAARDEAARVRGLGERRRPSLVARAIELVRAELAALPTEDQS